MEMSSKTMILWACFHADLVSGFTVPSPIISKQQPSLFELGPIARNGLAYNDVEIGDGRRILPGDTVLVYYIGSYQTGPFGAGKETVFDRTGT